MSLLKVFSVFDVKAEAYLRPFFVKTRGQAIRGFSDAVNDPQHEFHAHPDDYTLFQIGEFDEDEGKLIPAVPETCGNALQYLESDQ